MTSPEGQQEMPATQATLDQLGVSIQLEKFTSGSIYKPVAVPGSYQPQESHPQGFIRLIQAPIQGIYEAMDIIVLVLMLGGFIGVFRMSGMFESGVTWLAERLRGREALLIVIVTTLIGLGGTTFGMAEETLAFYPILVPIFLAAGYDALVPVASIYGGSTIGTMFSTVNPFAVIIASDAGGVNWTTGFTWRVVGFIVGLAICIAYTYRYANRVRKDPTRSLLYGKNVQPPSASTATDAETPGAPMDRKKWMLAVIFAATFAMMVIGVAGLHWWLLEMTALFLGMAIVAGFLIGEKEPKFIHAFLKGAEELLGVSLIIGIARGVTILMNNGLISDSVLHGASNLVAGIPGVGFVIILFFIFFGLTFFISSSSGMAVLTMPIMGPLARVVHVPVEQAVNAYLMGFGVMTFITPTGLILPSLVMVDVSFGTWMKFITPLLLILTTVSLVFLALGVMMS